MKPKPQITVLYNDSFGQPFLILSVRDAIAREVADFLELVPEKSEALHLLMGAIERGITIHDKRLERSLKAA